VVYAGGKAGVGAFDLTSGRPLWHAHPAPDRSDAWSCFARPLALGGLLILLVQRRGIVALDRDSGREVWAREIGVEYMYPGPVEASGLILTGSPPGRVTALEPEGGRIAWTRTVTEAGHLSGLCGGDGACYVAAPTGEVAAFGLSRGRRRWRLRLGRELLDMSPYRRGASGAMGGPLVAGGRLILGAGDGHLRVLDCRDGRELDRWRFGAPISAPPDVGTGRLAVGAYDGRIACFGLD
jgi:outer membrane protein assembly factor BamB